MSGQPGVCPISMPKGRKGSLARKTHTLSQEPPGTQELLGEATERPTKAATTAGQTPAPPPHTSRCAAQARPPTGSRIAQKFPHLERTDGSERNQIVRGKPKHRAPGTGDSALKPILRRNPLGN